MGVNRLPREPVNVQPTSFEIDTKSPLPWRERIRVRGKFRMRVMSALTSASRPRVSAGITVQIPHKAGD